MFDAMQWDELTPEEHLIAQQAVESFRPLNQARAERPVGIPPEFNGCNTCWARSGGRRNE